MKKLMFMLATIALAFGVQAAAVSWKATNAAFANGTVYAITGLSAAQVVAYFQSTTAADWDTAVSGAASAGANNRGVGSGGSEDVGSTMVFAFVSSIAEGGTWAVTGDVSTDGFTYTPPATKPGTLSVTADNFATSGTFTAGVPEPTSGLLMLVGLGALALRRRRA